MKKLNKLLSFTIIFATIFSVPIFLQIPAFADIGAPYTFEYDVVVSNPEGAQLLESKWDKEKKSYYYEVIDTVPEKTRLTVLYEFERNGQKMMDVEYDGRNYEIKASDVKYADDVFDFSKISKNSTPLMQYIVNEESYLYKGPNERYGKNDDNYHLPAGIVVTSEYYDGLWLYVEYEGHSGWIKHMHAWIGDRNTANIATGEWDRSFITTRNKIELKDSPQSDGKVISTLEVTPLTEIPVLYYIPTSKFTTEVYISYNQHAGWYTKDSASYDVAFWNKESSGKDGLTVKETRVTSLIDSDTSYSSIPANTEFSILYTASKGWYGSDGSKAYIRANLDDDQFVEGWIDGNDYAVGTYKDGQYRDIYIEHYQPILDGIDGQETGFIAKSGSIYKLLYYYTIKNDEGSGEEAETWYLIGNGFFDELSGEIKYIESGWIKALNNDEARKIDAEIQEKLRKQMENEEPEETYTYPTAQNSDEAISERVVNMMLWLLGGFGLLSTTIIISLIIAKKHRKNRKPSEESEENQTENSPKSEKLSDENGPKFDEEADEAEPNSDQEVEENSKNREENEKKEGPKPKKDSGEIEKNIDEFLAENSPNSQKLSSDIEPESKKDDAKSDQEGGDGEQ